MWLYHYRNTWTYLKHSFDDAVLSIVAVFYRYKQFKSVRNLIEDSGMVCRQVCLRIKTNIKMVRNLLAADHCIKCRTIEQDLGIPKTIIQWILKPITPYLQTTVKHQGTNETGMKHDKWVHAATVLWKSFLLCVLRGVIPDGVVFEQTQRRFFALVKSKWRKLIVEKVVGEHE